MSNAPEVVLEFIEPHARYRTFDLSSAALLLTGFAVDLMGWSMKNTSGSSAAAIDLYDSPDGSGTPVFSVVLAANGLSTPWYGPNGIRMNNAVYANVTAGEVKGSIFYRHIRR